MNKNNESFVAKTAQGPLGMRMLMNVHEENFRIERLISLGAKTFAGTTNPADAEIWIDKLEKCYNVTSCPDDEKVDIATFLLEGRADDWWKSIVSWRSNHEPISWSDFKVAFYEQYYPRSYRDVKPNRFLKLEQGSMTVAEYQKKYELANYATTIIEDEIEKCKSFVDGLREEIRTPVTAVEWKEFGKLVEAAMRVEKSISTRKTQGEPSKNISTNTSRMSNEKSFRSDHRRFAPGVASCATFKSRFHGPSSFRTTSNFVQPFVGSASQNVRSSIEPRAWQQQDEVASNCSTCSSCGKMHLGHCLKGTNICFSCGQAGHMRRECPLLLQMGGDAQGSSSSRSATNTTYYASKNYLNQQYGGI